MSWNKKKQKIAKKKKPQAKKIKHKHVSILEKVKKMEELKSSIETFERTAYEVENEIIDCFVNFDKTSIPKKELEGFFEDEPLYPEAIENLLRQDEITEDEENYYFYLED